MVHIYPINEIEDHVLIGTACTCNPRIELGSTSYYSKEDNLVVHNIFNDRSIYKKYCGYYRTMYYR